MVIESVSSSVPERSVGTSDEQTPPTKAMEGDMPAANIGIPTGSDSESQDDDGNDGPTRRRRRRRRRRMPQTIAHRGSKASAPENSLLGFRAAVEGAGADAVETDLHLSRDGVVVLAHDATLRRCYGVGGRVRDRDWADLSALRSLREPREPLIRLVDLLGYLNEPARAGVWVMLDIKTHDDARELMQRTAETIASVPGIRPWSERILPCCWTAEYVKLAQELLPGYRISHVGFSTAYARALADSVPGLGVSVTAQGLAMPVLGSRFMRDMRRMRRPTYAWTVNDEDWMRWAVRHRLAGVITDDPRLFREVCRRMREEEGEDDEEDSSDNDTAKKIKERRRRSKGVDSDIFRVSLRARLVRAPRRLYAWARYFFFLLVASVVYFFRWGLPSRQVSKVLAS
ncbi:PLC-like phosphodiesterase [Hypoxylon sp. FL1284]|nr:PLC-like phosphodiesterase [Hypoxylon sp. FL1284]